MRLPSLARWAGGALLLGVLVACGQSEEETRRLNERAAQILREQTEFRLSQGQSDGGVTPEPNLRITPADKEAKAKAVREEQAAELRERMLASRMVMTVRAVRDNLKSPRSFELVRAAHVAKTDTICIVYRGTNGFNAVMTESIAIDAKGKKLDWNRYCAGKQVTDWADKIAIAIR